MPALAALALLLGALPAARAQWLSPGPLAEDHKSLDDATSCEKCHAPGKRVEQARCLACHKPVAAGLKAQTGFHAKLVRDSKKSCEHCHSDHKGRTYPLIRWSPPATFDHGRDTGFALTGAHAQASCGACHDHRPGYMGAKKTCAECHKDPHKAELGSRCDQCHETTAFKPPGRFDHQKSKFPLEHAHAKASCAACHRRDAAGQVHYKVAGADNCATCHGDPHQGRTALSRCTDCHTTAGWTDVAHLPPAHSPAGWPLVGGHKRVDCADCHGADLAAKVQRSCASCHEDPHQGRFGAKCESCHSEAGWKQVKTAGFDHSRTRYPLEGRHKDLRCDQCHRPAGGRTTYRGLPFDRCDRCHKPYHAGPLTTAPSPTACEACHTVQGFDPSTFAAADHAKARFPLDGSHLAVACARCHLREPPKPTPLALGPKSCADCHADPHQGQFAPQMAASGQSCATCHATAGWKKDAFDHDATRFPLRGVHAQADCASCHKGDPIQYQGLPRDCAGCHADPHLGQFAEPPRPRDCRSCHTESTWRPTPFDHATQAGWPLEHKHAPLACASCHAALPLADGTTVVHYRLGTHACASCHENPHKRSPASGPARAGLPDLGGACDQCHTAADWRRVGAKVAFDHALTGFSLDGRHRPLDCAACHGSGLRTDDTRSACASCHEDVHRGAHGPACESCHDPRSWRPTDALLRHRATRFPLVGAHAAADCTACHPAARQDTYRAALPACDTCHAADYQRPDVHPNHVQAGFSRDCTQCHSQYSFSPARLQHDLFFPLRGAHAVADCFQCHTGERYGGTPSDCYACHRDDYARASDPPHAAYDMSRRCQGCHTDSTWHPARATWHDAVFRISSGDHARFACADCHFGANLSPINFTCIGCHTKSGTEGDHTFVPDYVWENFACYGCHGRD